MDKSSKLILPITILIASIILGGFYYASQANKQESIERQQALKLQEERRVEEVRTEQATKEYLAKRETNCLDIYKTESDKWNNVQGWRYHENDDACFIRYKSPDPKSDAQCDEDYPTGGDWGLTFFLDNSLCKDGDFENAF